MKKLIVLALGVVFLVLATKVRRRVNKVVEGILS